MRKMLLFTLLLVVSFSDVGLSIDHSLIDSYRPKPTSLIKSYEKVLKMSLESLYTEDEREYNLTARSILLSKNCTEAFDQFSDALINFTGCAVKYARPIHLCYECGHKYNASVSAYNNLKEQGGECQEFYFSSDQITIVDVLYDGVTQLWSKNNCPNCYLDPNLTETFFNVSDAFMDCVKNFNKTEFLPANTTCTKCHDLYAELSEKYSDFVQSPGDYGAVCMDVIDTMNITRIIWKDYNCIAPFDSSLGYPNIVVALAIGVTPVLFYLLAKNVSIIEDVKIVRPKRKYTPIVSTIEPQKD